MSVPASSLPFWQYIEYCLPYILEGFSLSIRLFFIVLVGVFMLSILVAVLKVSGPRWLRALLGIYTWVFRGTPLICLLVLAYFGGPHIGLVLDGMTVAVLVFILSAAAYETEIIRGGIISIDKGQYEACRALGMSYIQTMRRVIIPQTVRRVLPPSCSEAIILFKDTSLVTAIAVFDLMRHASNLAMRELRAEPFGLALIFYLAFSSLLVLVFSHLEKRFSVHL